MGLTDASRRPHRIHRLPEETTRKVIEVRQREGWCSETIAAYLKRQNIQVSSGSVHSILKQNQLITKPYKPRKQRTYIRFQREHPDSLWQTDIKYYGDQYLIAFLDDCSRYLTGIALLREATTSKTLHLLDATLRLGRTPRQILSDHGSQFYSDDSKSSFTKFCEQHGIEHILGSIGVLLTWVGGG